MKAPKEHEKFLAKKDYSFECSTIVFKPKEREFLKKYGYWIEALVEGKISPITKEQQRLIEVHKELVEPETKNEWTWIKLIERRKFEKDAAKVPHYSVRDASEKWFSRTDWKKMRSWRNS